MSLGPSFPPGLTGTNPGHWSIARPLSCTFWSSPIHLGLFRFTMVQTLVRLPTHRLLLAGMTQVDSGRTRFSSRLTVLRISRHRGDDAVPPTQRSVSSKRIAPTTNGQKCTLKDLIFFTVKQFLLRVSSFHLAPKPDQKVNFAWL